MLASLHSPNSKPGKCTNQMVISMSHLSMIMHHTYGDGHISEAKLSLTSWLKGEPQFAF